MNSLRNFLDAQISSHTRRIAHARMATVSAIDPTTGMLKVMIQPDNTETGWIWDCAVSVGNLTCYAPPDIGAHVMIDTAQGDGDNYVVTGRIFDAIQPVPTFQALGNRAPASGELGIKSGDTEFVISSSGVNIIGNISVQGNISVTGDVTAQNVSLASHIHGGVQAGSAYSAPPSPAEATLERDSLNG